MALSACSGPAADDQGLSDQSLTVFAASSLAPAFQALEPAFEELHPGADVVFNFGGSPALRTQLEIGARADLYTPADTRQMELALGAGVVRDAGEMFAASRLVVITPRDSAAISTLDDLARPGLRIVLGLPDVPVGWYAREALEKMSSPGAYGAAFKESVLSSVVSQETNVGQVIAKVAIGEADAAIVYALSENEVAANRLAVVPIPDPYNVQASYPIAITTSANNPELAQRFIDFLRSSDAQALLRYYGFEPTPAS